MSGEKILLISDSIEGPTGFGVNGANIAWCLAKEYEVHVLGLQSLKDAEITLKAKGDERTVIEHANVPRRGEIDFGERSLPRLLNQIKPDLLMTINDIQCVQYIPSVLYPAEIKLRILDMPSRKLRSLEELKMELEAIFDRFREKYPPKLRWVMYAPQDGQPPIPEWLMTYYACDEVVAMSKYGQEIFLKWFMLPVDYIYHAVDTDLFIPREKPDNLKDYFVIGDINRNQPRKQPIRLIEAFAKFAKDKDDVRLWLQKDWNDVYGWPLLYFVRTVYNIEDKVIPPRPYGISRAEVARIYSCWDLNAMPTAGEGFGLPIIEAGSCGIPTVATDYTTPKELIIDGEPSPRGKLVPYVTLYWDKPDVAAPQRALIDTDKLAEAFQYYYENRDELKRHGENAREWAKRNVDLLVIQKQWLKKVKEVLNK